MNGDEPSNSGRAYPHLSQLVADLLLALASHGHDWRVPADAVDATYDSLIDRILEGSPPDDFQAWAWCVLRNHLRAGPDRVGLRARRTRVLANPDMTEDSREESRSRLSRRWLAELAAQARSVLTELEWSALQAMLTEPTMTRAAVKCGMSRRDLRTRCRRIVRKMRAFLQNEDLP